MHCVNISRHYAKRFKKRIANSSRIEEFAEKAFEDGISARTAEDKRLSRYLRDIEEENSYGAAVLYKGFIHIFDVYTMKAITVYRAPRFIQSIA